MVRNNLSKKSKVARLAWVGASLFMAVSRASATVVTFQQGVGGYTSAVDTYLQQAGPNNANSAAASVQWDGDDPAGTGQDNVALIRFDNIFGNGAGQIPAGSTINSATLSYTVFDSGDVGPVYESLVGWTAVVTWNTFGGTAGVQASEYGNYQSSAGALANGTSTADVTDSLIRWSANPALNLGWIILPTDANGVQIRSSEYATISLRPKLTVDYGGAVPTLVRRPYLQLGTPTSMTVCWRTNAACDSRVRYGAAPGSLTTSVTNLATGIDHAITITGLNPNTKYYYDVGTTTTALAGNDVDHYWVTQPTVGTHPPFSFWVVGDSGTGLADQASVRDAMLAVTGATPPDIFMHVGDIAYNSGTETEFTNNHFAPYQNILRHTVCWPTLGNHEGTMGDSASQTGPYYIAFVLPKAAEAGGLASGTEAYYSFDYADVHFICLDSNDSSRAPGSAMLTWLQNDLAATQRNWVIAFWHHPPYTKGSHDSDDPADSGGRLKDMRENVLPILEAGGVDLVLSGHSHSYERSYLVDGAYDTPTTAAGHIVNSGDGRPSGNGAYLKSLGQTAHEGAVYVVSGHGGASLGGTIDHPLMYFSELAFGSCVVTIDRNKLSLVNIRFDQAQTDNFTIIKTPPGDLDIDGNVDGLDLTNFVNVLLGIDLDAQHIVRSDINVDSTANGLDIQGFVDSFLVNG